MVDVLDVFFSRLGTGGRALLLTDYDGTLAPFVTDRMQARPYAGVAERIARIAETGRSEVIVVSGRPAEEVAALLDVEPLPEVWGCHGWERLKAGATRVLEVLPQPPEVADKIRECAGRLRAEAPQESVETKNVGLAVHWRGVAFSERKLLERTARAVIEATAGALVREGVLELRRFDGGMELRYAGRTKGDVVREILASRPPGLPCAYLGDDETDEDAFAALSGRGLTVLVRSDHRHTLAEVWLRPPEGLIDFLERWLEAR